jgi:hypothetical protein
MNALGLRRDPFRLAFSKAPWSAAWYLTGYLFIGTVLFAIALTAVLTGAALGITLAGIPLLVAAAAVVRWCADVERRRLRPRFGDVEGDYRAAAAPGVLAQLSTRWHDPATWRDIAYLVGMYVPLLALDVIVLALWLTFLAGITLPAWYWAPWQSVHGTRFHGYQLGYFPNGPHGHPGYGLYIDTLPKALLAAAVSLILFLACNYALVATARAHTAVARALLGRSEDPLREAKEVLRRPGPLNTLIPNDR